MLVYEVEKAADTSRRSSLSNSSSDRFSKRSSYERDGNGVAGLVNLQTLQAKNVTLPVHKTENGLSWAECVFQIFFSIQGPAFFVLPAGFKRVGWLFGLTGATAVGIFYIYMMQTYLWCEKELRARKRIDDDTPLSINSLVDLTFMDVEHKPRRRYADWINRYLKYEIILSWSFSLSFAELFACDNIRLILNYYGYTTSNATILFTLFPITTFISWIPNLRVMSCIAYFSTTMIVLIMLEILYFVAVDPTPLAVQFEIVYDSSSSTTFLATVFFTIVTTPLIFPLKNEMQTPAKFGSVCGSFNTAICVIIVLNVFFSLFGYIKYGPSTAVNILENLPRNEFMTLSNCALTVAMIMCGSISFFVVFETIWNGHLKNLFAESSYVLVYEYVGRTLTNLFIMMVALTVPTLDVYINLISCFSYPFDSIFVPILLHTMLIWRRDEDERGISFYFYVILNSILFVVCVCFSILTFVNCLHGLIECYTVPAPAS